MGKRLSQADMRMIRRDTDICNSQIKRDGDGDTKYVDLHPWGCGCCFTIVKTLKPAPKPPVQLGPTDAERYERYFAG